MPCSLQSRNQVYELTLDLLEVITGGQHVPISEETELDDGATGLGFDSIAVRGWCGTFRKKVREKGCRFTLTPDDFQGFKTVADIVSAICKDLDM